MSNLGNAFFILSLAVGTANCWVALLQDQSVPSSSQVPIASYDAVSTLAPKKTKLNRMTHIIQTLGVTEKQQFSNRPFILPLRT